MHVPRAEILSVLGEIHMVLGARGILLTSLKVGLGESRDALGRYNVYYSEPEWGELLKAAGFETVRASERLVKGPQLCGGRSEVVWLTHIAVKVEAQAGACRA